MNQCSQDHEHFQDFYFNNMQYITTISLFKKNKHKNVDEVFQLFFYLPFHRNVPFNKLGNNFIASGNH